MSMLSRTSTSRGPNSPDVVGFCEPDTGPIQYIMIDPSSRQAALIDCVLEFDPRSAAISTKSVDEILAFVRREDLTVKWVLDTHPHADHLMASTLLKERLGAPNAIGEKVREVADLWRGIYNMPQAFDVDRDFDRLFADGDEFQLGSLPVRVMLSPGHTLASITYIVGDDAAFVHDTFMQPDSGTARADFPGGSAATLYDSLQAILALPDDCRLFIGHDYGAKGRESPAWESTVTEQREKNSHIGGGESRDAYIEMREERDRTLSLPDRMLHVLQLNLRAGRLPAPEADGAAYLKIPLNKF